MSCRVKLLRGPGITGYNLSVSEHMGWVRNVVLMNVYLCLEKPQGVGISGEGPHGQVRQMRGVRLRATRERGGPVTARRVPSKWKRGARGARG